MQTLRHRRGAAIRALLLIGRHFGPRVAEATTCRPSRRRQRWRRGVLPAPSAAARDRRVSIASRCRRDARGGIALYLLLCGRPRSRRCASTRPHDVVRFLGSALPIVISVINSSVIPAITKPLGVLLGSPRARRR